MTYNTEYNRQGDSPESLIITPPHLLAALVGIVGPISKTHLYYHKDRQLLLTQFYHYKGRQLLLTQFYQLKDR